MIIRDEVETGWPSAVNLRRRVSAFIREGRAYRYKIGITTNPFWRARQHRGYYNEMIVVYQTSSQKFVRRLERILTNYYKEFCDNERAGGAGRWAVGTCFLYVLVRR